MALDVPVAHLDRWFDYAIPESMAEDARPGVRVQARFNESQAGGFIIEVSESSDYAGELLPLQRVISPEQVLTPEQVRLCRAVADHWCGTFADVVRMAVPPRHATTEKATRSPWPIPQPSTEHDSAALPPGPLQAMALAVGFLEAIVAGAAPRAFWQVPPTSAPVGDWTEGIGQTIEACLRSGRGSLVVVPDERDLRRVHSALVARFGKGTVAVLHAGQGPSSRYRNYLAASRGEARIVIGTRSAALAPVADCGLLVVWDDGDDLHSELRTPYFHVREVLALRAVQQHAALLVASRARTVEVQRWVESGWLVALELERRALRKSTAAIKVAGADDVAMERDPLARSARIPAEAFKTLRTGLSQGPVLVQVSRAGYAVALACERCRTRFRCQACHGPMQADKDGHLHCGWCGRVSGAFRCEVCGHGQMQDQSGLRAPVVGAVRTAEEFGRAFPGTRVIDSSQDHVVDEVADEPALVIATPGAEPVAPGGYAACVLLDTTMLMARADLRASEEALRRWLNAVGLVRSGADGGTVCAVGPSEAMPLQALVRTDPGTLAMRELQDRREAGFPPAARFVQVEGTTEAIDGLVASSRLLPEHGLLPGTQVTEPLDGLDVLGPVPLDARVSPVGGVDEDLHRLTLRVPLQNGAELLRRVRAGLGVRAARKLPPVRVRVDPRELA